MRTHKKLHTTQSRLPGGCESDDVTDDVTTLIMQGRLRLGDVIDVDSFEHGAILSRDAGCKTFGRRTFRATPDPCRCLIGRIRLLTSDHPDHFLADAQTLLTQVA